jgi:acetoin utilization deacetylase AcuC-like enzyme
VVLIDPPLLTPNQVEQVHCRRYVRAVRAGKPRGLAETNGFEWDAGIWTSALASTSGMVTAALYALRRRLVAGSLSSGLHHARRGSGGGFCTINGLPLAARAAIEAGAQRVLILDLDAHAGGGTFSVVRDWPEIWGVDVSITKQVDRYEPRQCDRFQLDIVTDAGAYLPTIWTRLEAVGQIAAFDLVLYNAGIDPHEDSWDIEGITTETIAERERLVFQWAADRGVRVAFCPAGGYTGPRMSQDALVALHRLTIAAAVEYGLP